MKKFKFKLDTPLKVKQIKEKLEKQRLRETILSKNKEQKQLNTLKTMAHNTRRNMSEMLVEHSEVRDIYGFDIYINNIKTLVERQKIAVHKAQELYDLTRTSYIEKRRDKEMLEKLEEKSFLGYSKELYLEEQNLSDELGGIAYERRERDVCNGHS